MLKSRNTESNKSQSPLSCKYGLVQNENNKEQRTKRKKRKEKRKGKREKRRLKGRKSLTKVDAYEKERKIMSSIDRFLSVK